MAKLLIPQPRDQPFLFTSFNGKHESPLADGNPWLDFLKGTSSSVINGSSEMTRTFLLLSSENPALQKAEITRAVKYDVVQQFNPKNRTRTL
jgi:hypothetical protein